jgi:hypothetical protein
VRAYVVLVAEIEGEKTEQFVTEGKFSLLRRVMFSAAEAASACVRVAPGAKHSECFWTDDVDVEKLEQWQYDLMQAVEEKENE